MVVAEPEGTVRPGQRLHLVTRALGWTFAVTAEVREVDAGGHRLRLLAELPFGGTSDEAVSVARAGDGRALVRFDRQASFRPGWPGVLARALLARKLRRGAEASLRRLKRAAEPTR